LYPYKVRRDRDYYLHKGYRCKEAPAAFKFFSIGFQLWNHWCDGLIGAKCVIYLEPFFFFLFTT